MKKLIVGTLMLALPIGYMFYLLAIGSFGFWKTAGFFAMTIFWTFTAVGLMYGGFKKIVNGGRKWKKKIMFP